MWARHNRSAMRIRSGEAGVAWAAAACSLVLCIAALVLVAQASGASAAEQVSLQRTAAFPLSILAFAVAGAVIATRRPRNPIGWLFCGIGLTGELQAAALSYVQHAIFTAPGSAPSVAPIAWLVNTWVVMFGLVPLLFLLFPDGQLLSPRWRPVVWLTPANMVVGFFTVGLDLGPVTSQVPLLEDLFGPQAGGSLVQVGRNIHESAMLVAFVAGAASLALRLRRARGDERAQLKWFAYASLVLACVLVMLDIIFVLPVRQSLDPNAPPAPPGLFFGVPFGLALAGVPVAAGVAILKYRLYDIDLLINRTLVYAGLTACVVGIYILIVGYLGSLLPSGGNSALSLLATGIIAILFQPLRERLQRGINRLLYGQRDEPYAVLSKLGQRLEATLAPEAVLSTIVQTVREALKLSYTAIALQRSEKLAIAAEVGTAASDPLRLPLMYQREPVGELLLGSRAAGEAFSAADRRLLDDLARQAGVAVHAVRLTGDLQQSRMRLVSAREEERRRLRRDLHDGLGPELASMTLQTEAAREYLTSDPTRSDALLADLTAQLQAATAEIRRLVYELRPPALDDLGLAAALRTLAARYDHEAPDALRVDVEAWAFPRSLPAAAEVAAYRICQEALTNVVRHASARHCTLRLVLTNENGRSAALSVEIRDDGRGLPVDRRAGVGLASMRERAAELGGTCSIETVPTGGTRVTAMLPLPVLTPSASAVESEPSPELTVGSTA